VPAPDHRAASSAFLEDSASGKLDFLFDEVEAERKAGLLREWPAKEE
jgi:hypothetical protein